LDKSLTHEQHTSNLNKIYIIWVIGATWAMIFNQAPAYAQPGLPKTYVGSITTQHTETFARAANAALECEKSH